MTSRCVVTVGPLRTSTTRPFARRGTLGGFGALVTGALVAAVLSVSGAGLAVTSGAASGRDGLAALLRLPAAAQAPISAALGRDLAGYHINGLAVTRIRGSASLARFGRAGAAIEQLRVARTSRLD